MSLKNKRIFIDMDRCIGCGSHEVACSIHHNGDTNLLEAEVESKDAQIPMHCRHCEQPLCEMACPKEAITKDEDGIVTIAKMRCVGCKSCVNACPFGVITTETKYSVITKCDLAKDRLERGELPNCVATCPTGAIKFIDMDTELDDILKIGSREIGKNKFMRRTF